MRWDQGWGQSVKGLVREASTPGTCLMGRAPWPASPVNLGWGALASYRPPLPRRRHCGQRMGGSVSGRTSRRAATSAPPAPLSPFCVVIPLILQDRPLSCAPSAPSESKEGPSFLDLAQDRLLSVHLVSKRPFRVEGHVLG